MTKNTDRPIWSRIAKSFPFDLSLVAEETGNDFRRSLEVARSLGIRNIDFGSLWGRRIDHVTLGDMIAARELLAEFDVQTRIVATEAFKPVVLGSIEIDSIPNDPHYQEQLALFRASLSAALSFGASMVRIYSFRRDTMTGLGNPSLRFPRGGEFPDEMIEKVAAALRPALSEAASQGITLAMENVRSCWCDSGHNTRLLLQTVDSPWLKVIWDPANAFVSGEEDVVVDGYAAVRSSIAHVHLKDAIGVDEAKGLTEWVCIGDGSVNLSESLRALKDDKYSGCVSIETHWHPEGSDMETNTRAAYSGLMTLLEGVTP